MGILYDKTWYNKISLFIKFIDRYIILKGLTSNYDY